MSLGNNIRLHRKRAGMTQSDLAKAAGFSHTTIAAVEVNRVTPKESTLLAIAAALGVERADLDTPPTTVISDRALLRQIVHMMNEYRARIEREARR